MDTLPNLLLLCISILVCGEVIFRIYLRYYSHERVFKRYATYAQVKKKKEKNGESLALTPHRYLGYYPTPGYRNGGTTHNIYGYRGSALPRKKARDEYRILTLGGSTTYGFGIDEDNQTYPSQLQTALHNQGYDHVRVINFGVNGYGVRECLINFIQRGLDLHPDMVIFYEGINDVHNRLVWPPESYVGDDITCRPPLVDHIYNQHIYERSALFRALLIKMGRLSPQIDLNRTLIPTEYRDDQHGHCYTYEFIRQRNAKVYPKGIFSEVPVMKMLDKNRPTYFQRHLEALAAITKASQIDLLLATFAISPYFEDPVVNSPEYQRAISEHNDVQREVSGRLGVPLLDLDSILGDSTENFIDGRHFTIQGCTRMAQFMAIEIDKQCFIPFGNS